MNLSRILKSLATILISLSMLSLATPGLGDETLASGSFTGASGHKTSGSVTIVKTAAGLQVVLGDNFKFDGAPDPKVGFGKRGKYDIKSQLEILRANSGKQSYPVPASLNIDGYDEVYIWCEKYSVPLGVAKIR